MHIFITNLMSETIINLIGIINMFERTQDTLFLVTQLINNFVRYVKSQNTVMFVDRAMF